MRYDLFRIISSSRKRKAITNCGVNIGHSGDLEAYDDKERRVVLLEQSKVVWMGVAGIRVTGYCPTGRIRSGQEEYELQEWFLRYRE